MSPQNFLLLIAHALHLQFFVKTHNISLPLFLPLFLPLWLLLHLLKSLCSNALVSLVLCIHYCIPMKFDRNSFILQTGINYLLMQDSSILFLWCEFPPFSRPDHTHQCCHLVTLIQLWLLTLCTLRVSVIIMAALPSRCGHCIFALWFLSSFFYSSPNLSGRRLDVYHTSTHGVAFRI